MSRSHLVLVLVLVLVLGGACDVPVDAGRTFPARGAIRGTVTYVGPRPCSRDGHIVGSAIVLVFDRRNPPPPSGLGTTAANFVAVPGDALFASYPRSTSRDLFCPDDGTVANAQASAPFTIAPLEGGSYTISAFYDRRGTFWPTFAYREVPLAGDVAGGFATPVDVGVPRPSADGSIPDYTIGPNGFVADDVPVTIGIPVTTAPPYFHPSTLSIPQDVQILAPPAKPTPATLDAYQRGFPSLDLAWGVPDDEALHATNPAEPFRFQLAPLPPNGSGGLLVFAKGASVSIPEDPSIPDLWPEVALVRLAEPGSRVVQGTQEETLVTGKRPGPLVVLRGITLLDGSLPLTIAGPVPAAATTAALRDHVTTMIRPAALCFPPPLPTETDPQPLPRIDRGGVLVTPHLTGPSADPSANDGTTPHPLFDAARLAGAPLVAAVKVGCLPLGRYAISAAYPTGQVWTVPNETGATLASQGGGAVVQIVPPKDPSVCLAAAVPPECLPP